MLGLIAHSISSRRRTRESHETGAAAVEFGLISPLIFAFLFGTMTYGLWFNDSLNLRQGLREASRQAVVRDFGTDASCTASYLPPEPSENIKKLVCRTKEEVSAFTGTTYVKVSLPDRNGDGVREWTQGGELVICAMVHAEALPGIVPLPNDRMIRFQSRMSIEQVDVSSPELGGAEVPPTGANWDWCTQP